MKIVCRKETDIKKMLELVKRYIEKECMDYSVLEEELVLEIDLKDRNGISYPENGKVICFEEKDLQEMKTEEDMLESYYNKDALTKLYNRSKYEQDILQMQEAKIEGLTCIYIDAVGLHEINNHLGHAAGDRMLCRIAEGICQQFTNGRAYRIGGDEFVVFCFQEEEKKVKQAILELKKLLKQEKYEISVGVQMNQPELAVMEIINSAEEAMRADKINFYKKNGGKRQLRSLNYELEKILLEKQDAHQFLNVIASEYKGVYMVNPQKDICRYIYIPKYFEEMLEHSNGVFSKAIQEYCDTLVCERDKAQFQEYLDFDYVLEQLRQGQQIEFDYEKQDGGKVRMQITIYDQNSEEKNEMLWIFMDGDKI